MPLQGINIPQMNAHKLKCGRSGSWLEGKDHRQKAWRASRNWARATACHALDEEGLHEGNWHSTVTQAA
jgi:hypothetical protein